jgi:hypothetical protein
MSRKDCSGLCPCRRQGHWPLRGFGSIHQFFAKGSEKPAASGLWRSPKKLRSKTLFRWHPALASEASRVLLNNTRENIMHTKTEAPIETKIEPLYTIPPGLSREEFYAYLDQIMAGEIKPDSFMTLYTYAAEEEA